MQALYIGNNSILSRVLKKICDQSGHSLEVLQKWPENTSCQSGDLVFATPETTGDTIIPSGWHLVLAATNKELEALSPKQLGIYDYVLDIEVCDRTLKHRIEVIMEHLARTERQGNTLAEKNNYLEGALAKAQQHIELHEEVLSKIQKISQLSRQINCLDLDRISSICMEAVPQLISARFASLYSFDHKNEVLHLLRHNHPYTIDRLVIAHEHPRSPMVMAVMNKQLRLIKNFSQWKPSENRPVQRQFTHNYRSNSCIIAPLLSGNNVVGVLNLADKIDADGFDEDRDLPPIELLCEIIGSAMTNIQLYEKVMRQARTDGVTGLLNHRAFYRELDREVSRQKRYGGNLSLIMVDLDGLKKVNDTFGHRAGDSAIRHVAQKIKLCIRQTDIAARYGGDEFAIILPNTQLEDAMVVARRLVKLVSGKSILFDHQELNISVSVGLGELKADTSLEDLMNRADMALFEAKTAGKNRMQVFSETKA